MKTFVFAWYPEMPIACEGDDQITRAIHLRLKEISRIDRAISSLELRHGGFVQFWEVLNLRPV